MKNSNFLRMACVAVMCTGGILNLSAQTKCSFTRVGSQDEMVQDLFCSAQRTIPVFGDFNNDGFLDFIYGGENGLPWPSEADVQVEAMKCISNLVKNNGDGTYTVLTKDDTNIPVNIRSTFHVFDFNNDGYLDLLLNGGRDGASDEAITSLTSDYTYLLKNLGPEQNFRFELIENSGFRMACNQKSYIKNISAGDYNKDGWIDIVMVTEDSEGRHVDLYKNNQGNGTFSLQEVAHDKNGNLLPNFKKFSSGVPVFADIDKDGWLDLVVNGYSNDDPNVDVRIYKNMTNGTFKDITPDYMIGQGSYEGEVKVADLNSDGFLDILLMGNGASSRQATIWYNDGAGNFTKKESGDTGLIDLNGSCGYVTDLNHDGYVDIIYTGKHGDGSVKPNRRVWICYQDHDGMFQLDDNFPIMSVGADGAIAVGDIDNNGSLDVFVTGKTSDNVGEIVSVPVISYLARIYLNDTETNNPPQAPSNVQAELIDGQLNITWDASLFDDKTAEAAFTYNIMVKNEKTGAIFMLLPADPETGSLKRTHDLQVATPLNHYSMSLQEGEYTIGVQTLDQGMGASNFATVKLEEGGKENINTLNYASASISIKENGVVVGFEQDVEVMVSDLVGRKIAQGRTNRLITLPAKGIFMVTIGPKTFKIRY